MVLAAKAVPPVLPSRVRSSSAVRARFRAASGTGPCTAEEKTRPFRSAETVSAAGLPLRTTQPIVTGTGRFSPRS